MFFPIFCPTNQTQAAHGLPGCSDEIDLKVSHRKSLSRKHEQAEELRLAGGHGASAGSDLDSGIYGGGAQCGAPERTWGELNTR